MTARETFQGGPRARELFDQGMGCNAIARELGVGAATISRWARREGLSFARDETALAVRARLIDIADSRTLLTQKGLVIAHEAADDLDGPYLVHSFGGRDNKYAEHLLDTPPVEVKRTVLSMIKDAHAVAAKERELAPTGAARVESMIDRLAASMEAEFADVDDAEFTGET